MVNSEITANKNIVETTCPLRVQIDDVFLVDSLSELVIIVEKLTDILKIFFLQSRSFTPHR